MIVLLVLLGAVILSIIGDTIPFDRRGKAMGYVMAAFSMASVFGVPFGLFIATHYNWNTPFIFLAALALPIMYMIWKFVPNISGHVVANNENSFKIIMQSLDAHSKIYISAYPK